MGSEEDNVQTRGFLQSSNSTEKDQTNDAERSSSVPSSGSSGERSSSQETPTDTAHYELSENDQISCSNNPSGSQGVPTTDTEPSENQLSSNSTSGSSSTQEVSTDAPSFESTENDQTTISSSSSESQEGPSDTRSSESSNSSAEYSSSLLSDARSKPTEARQDEGIAGSGSTIQTIILELPSSHPFVSKYFPDQGESDESEGHGESGQGTRRVKRIKISDKGVRCAEILIPEPGTNFADSNPPSMDSNDAQSVGRIKFKMPDATEPQFEDPNAAESESEVESDDPNAAESKSD